MRVGQIMRKKVETISENGSVELALARMRDRRLRHLVVVRAGEVVGMLSDRDLVGLLAGKLRVDRDVSTAMSRGVATIAPEAFVADAARTMRRKKIGALPVVSGGELVGIVTASDLLDLLAGAPKGKAAGAAGRAAKRRPASRARS